MSVLVNPKPTQFREVNELLQVLVTGIQEILGDELVGAYLQGSFAVGDADSKSDVDFIVVIRNDIDGNRLAQLQVLHEQMYKMPTPWAQRLEGSYIPDHILRRWTLTPRDPPGEPRDVGWTDPGMDGMSAHVYPFYFLGNGAQSLVRSEHDNSQVVRWVVRERGIVLHGPHPRELIDPIPADSLCAEVAGNMSVYAAPYIAEPARLTGRWLCAFFIVLYCRMLHTLETGEVRSKAAGVAWATDALSGKWCDLVTGAWQARHDAVEEMMQAPSGREIAATIEFLQFAAEKSTTKFS